MGDPGFDIGLKLYSTNTGLAGEARKAYDRGLFDYIELYAIPGSFEAVASVWRNLAIPAVVHAAHFMHGINFARRDWRRQNAANFGDARRLADALGADAVIVHAGNGGPLEEAVEQIAALAEPRLAIENKPRMGLNGEVCVGWSPGEFRAFRDAGVLRSMVLDFGHAACSAVSARADLLHWVAGFFEFGPRLFHLVDGDGRSETDQHWNLGRGSLPIGRFLEMLPPGARVTLETPRDPARGLGDFSDDVRYVRRAAGGTP